jgi:hypothetical protein
MFERCPKCFHAPLPADQALPAACPGCGVILAKIGAAPARPLPVIAIEDAAGDSPKAAGLLLNTPESVEPIGLGGRVALWLAFAGWSWWLLRMDVRTGEFGESFLHRPLLIFHEAGHVLFMPLGEWMTIAGGTLGQLLVPAILGGALLWKNRDPFGASIGLWLVGMSLVDVAPYVYDALDPQLMLLGGRTGDDGPHDWIYLLRTMGLRERAQGIGLAVHAVGGLVVLLALAWGAWLLRLQFARLDASGHRA